MSSYFKADVHFKMMTKVFLGSIFFCLVSSSQVMAEDCKETAKQLRGDYMVLQSDGGMWRFMEKNSRLRDDSMLGLQIDGILQRGVTHVEDRCEEGKAASGDFVKGLQEKLDKARSINNRSSSRTPAKKLKKVIKELYQSVKDWAEKTGI